MESAPVFCIVAKLSLPGERETCSFIYFGVVPGWPITIGIVWVFRCFLDLLFIFMFSSLWFTPYSVTYFSWLHRRTSGSKSPLVSRILIIALIFLMLIQRSFYHSSKRVFCKSFGNYSMYANDGHVLSIFCICFVLIFLQFFTILKNHSSFLCLRSLDLVF